MVENELNVRLQHAVIGEGTSSLAVPKKGEIIFNPELNNCKIGNGNLGYASLPFLIPEHKVLYKIPTAADSIYNLEGYLKNKILYNGNIGDFSMDVYNHIVIADINNNISNTWFQGGASIYSVCSSNPNDVDLPSLYKYLREHPYKPLKITFVKPSSGDMLLGLFKNTGSSTSTDWIDTHLLCVNKEYQIYQYSDPNNINNISGIRLLMDGTCISIDNTGLACQSIQMTCVDPDPNPDPNLNKSIFLIE